MVLPPDGPASGHAGQSRWRRRHVRPRHRAARPDHSAQRADDVSVRCGALCTCRRCQSHPRPSHERHLRRRLVGIFRLPPYRRFRRCAVPPRPAVGFAVDRCHRHRPLLAAVRLARWPQPHRLSRWRPADPRPRVSQIERHRRRGLRLVLRQRHRPPKPGAHTDHGRPRQTVGLPLQRCPRVVAKPASQSHCGRREPDANFVGPAIQAVLVPGNRLRCRRQGVQRTQRLCRPKKQ